MEKLKVEMEVAKEAYELGQGLVELVKVLKEAMKDGFQAGQDLPVLVAAAVQKLPMAIEGMDKIPDEMKDHEAFAKAILASAADMWAALGKKA